MAISTWLGSVAPEWQAEPPLTATPFTVAGVLLLLPSQDPLSLTERGTELFLPVFSPTVQIGGATLKDTPRDALLVNRSHLRRVNATMRR